MIDLGIAPFVQRVINEAASEGAAAVILEINTFGGRVDGAVIIRDALLTARVKTVAFVNKRAISAGALISLAAETIAMSDGATIGAAAPMQIGQPGGPAQPVEEKTVSYVRKEFLATAEACKRPPLLAEALFASLSWSRLADSCFRQHSAIPARHAAKANPHQLSFRKKVIARLFAWLARSRNSFSPWANASVPASISATSSIPDISTANRSNSAHVSCRTSEWLHQVYRKAIGAVRDCENKARRYDAQLQIIMF
jgi:hypothetical protein